MALHRLDDAQILWRQAKRFQLGERFDAEYPEDPARCFLRSGRPVFGDEAVGGLRSQPWLRGDEKEAYWEEPEPHGRYVIGADPAEGLRHGDASAAVVLRRPPEPEEPMQVVARLRGQWPPEVFAQRLYDLSCRYNKAELVVEKNNHGHAVLLELEHLGANLWRPRASAKERTQPGFSTTQSSKMLVIDRLDMALRERSLHTPCQAIIGEIAAFQHLDDGSMSAPSGASDDLVMALALATHACLQPVSWWQDEATQAEFAGLTFEEYRERKRKTQEEVAAILREREMRRGADSSR
jgi:hypothetical protein